MPKWSTKVAIINFKYRRECDKCKRRALWSFEGKDGKMHGACRKHLKEVA
jgi:hypothetical protein